MWLAVNLDPWQAKTHVNGRRNDRGRLSIFSLSNQPTTNNQQPTNAMHYFLWPVLPCGTSSVSNDHKQQLEQKGELFQKHTLFSKISSVTEGRAAGMRTCSSGRLNGSCKGGTKILAAEQMSKGTSARQYGDFHRWFRRCWSDAGNRTMGTTPVTFSG